ncbi:MAG: DASS family sodium-coupled anion symporter [Acidimicrobiia bacterium]|nr:DASS family sodium-coupled anion symporter [Acidimicrobiia bacterium]
MVPEVVVTPPASGARRWQLIAAVLLAATGWLIAPAPWPEGDGLLTVTVGDQSIVVPVEIGRSDRVTVDRFDVGIIAPEGVRADAPVVVVVEAPAGDTVAVAIDLPDGRVERIPVQRYDAESGAHEATRRPPVGARAVIALLGLVIVLWISEAVPLFVTSLLIPVVLVAAEVGSAREALAPFFHPIIALFFGGFLMAEAMRRVGLDRLAAVYLVSTTGRNPKTLLFGLMAVSAFLSMWMSNTAAAAVLVPVAIAVTAPVEVPEYRRTAVLGIAYAATIGGVGSAIGTPANPLAIEFLESFAGRQISFAGWFAFGLPMVILMLPIIGVYLWWSMGVEIDPASFVRVRDAARSELRSVGRLERPQLTVLGVFVGVMFVWLTQTWHGIDTGIVALAGAVALAALGTIVPEDLGRISWTALLTFGGGLTLGVFLTESGASDWLATRLGGLEALPAAVGVGVIGLVALTLTTVASNTAAAAMMIPLAIPLAGVIGVEPTFLVLVVAVASSIDFALVVGTPPTMIAYSTGLFRTREIFRIGIVLDVIGLLLLVTVVAAIWGAMGLL